MGRSEGGENADGWDVGLVGWVLVVVFAPSFVEHRLISMLGLVIVVLEIWMAGLRMMVLGWRTGKAYRSRLQKRPRYIFARV